MTHKVSNPSGFESRGATATVESCGFERGTVDWDVIRAEYIAGKLSQRKLAEKYGVSNAALQKRAQREKWTALRDEAVRKASEKVVQKTAAKRADAAVEAQRIGIKMLHKIEMELDKMLERPGTRIENISGKGGDIEGKRPQNRLLVEYDFTRLASAYATVARSMGLDAASERLRIERERLALEQKKFELECGGKDETDAINAGILSLADLINNPQPDRNLEDIMREDDEHA